MEKIMKELMQVMGWLNAEDTTRRIKEAEIAVTMAVTREAEFVEQGVTGRSTLSYTGDFAGMTVSINSMIDNAFKGLSTRQKLVLKASILACLIKNTNDLDEDELDEDNDE